MSRSTCKALVDRFAVLTRDVRTRGGDVLEKGWRVRVVSTWRGRFAITRVDAEGATIIRPTPGGHTTWHARGVDRCAFDPEP